MLNVILCLVLAGLFAIPAYAQQQASEEAAIRAAVPYATMLRESPWLTLQDYDAAVRAITRERAGAVTQSVPQWMAPPSPVRQPTRSRSTPAGPPSLVAEDGTYLGTLSSNRYDADSISNPYGRYGSRYSPESVNNPYGMYGSPYSPYSATNPYATQAPQIVNPYLGRLSTNPYAPDSTSNRYGPYGSPYSPSSITNPYSTYGSPFSPSSVTNPYAISPLPPLVPLAPLSGR